MKCIGKKRRFYIVCIYILAILLWFFLVLLLGIYKSSASLVLWLAPIVFLLSMYHAKSISPEVEEKSFNLSFFGTGIIIAVTLLGWSKELIKTDPNLFVVLCVAFFFILLGNIDIWLPVKWNLVYSNIRNVFQIYAIILFCYFILSLIEMGPDKIVQD